jgi:hypothetical protein
MELQRAIKVTLMRLQYGQRDLSKQAFGVYSS